MHIKLEASEIESIITALKSHQISLKTQASAARTFKGGTEDLETTELLIDRLQDRLNRSASDLISPGLTRHLHRHAVEYIAEMDESLRLYDAGETEGNDWVDPNDYIIWQNFVLSVLEESLDEGFYKEDMLDKGFGFLVGTIPGYLARHRELSEKDQGILFKMYFDKMMELSTVYAEGAGGDYFITNFPRIKVYLDAALRAYENLTSKRDS